jgi:hypothetical protein
MYGGRLMTALIYVLGLEFVIIALLGLWSICGAGSIRDSFRKFHQLCIL